MDTPTPTDITRSSDRAYRLTVGALSAVAHLPLRALYGLSDLAYLVLYRVVGYRRKVVRDNLRRAFPDASEKQIKVWERGFYRHLCDIFIEAVKLLHMPDSEVDERINIHGADLVNDAIAGGRSVVLMLGHYGNWEWVPAIVRKFSEGTFGSQIYHPLDNKLMDRVMLKIRSRFGTQSIPMDRAVRTLIGVERAGDHFVCGFIADQRPNGSNYNHWTDFLGIDTPYVVGGETIGDHLGAVYLYLDVEKTSRGHYSLTFKPIEPPDGDAESYPHTRRYLAMLEETIRRAPQYWLWSHKRWKRSRPAPEESPSGKTSSGSTIR